LWKSGNKIPSKRAKHGNASEVLPTRCLNIYENFNIKLLSDGHRERARVREWKLELAIDGRNAISRRTECEIIKSA